MECHDGLARACGAGNPGCPIIVSLNETQLGRMEEDCSFLPRVFQRLHVAHDAETAQRIGVGAGRGRKGRLGCLANGQFQQCLRCLRWAGVRPGQARCPRWRLLLRRATPLVYRSPEVAHLESVRMATTLGAPAARPPRRPERLPPGLPPGPPPGPPPATPPVERHRWWSGFRASCCCPPVGVVVVSGHSRGRHFPPARWKTIRRSRLTRADQKSGSRVPLRRCRPRPGWAELVC